MMLAPLATDDIEEDIYSDIVDEVEPTNELKALAADGLVLDGQALKLLTANELSSLSEGTLSQANHFIRAYLWPRVQEYRAAGNDTAYALDRIDLSGGGKGSLDSTGRDGGFSHYRKLIETLFNRGGGVKAVVQDVMQRCGATPAHAWRQLRDENRRSVEKAAMAEYDVPLPKGWAKYTGSQLFDAVAEAVFGPEAIGASGKADMIYATAAQVLVERSWESLTRRLKTAAKNSKKAFHTFEAMRRDAEKTELKKDMDGALRALNAWRVEATKTMEVEDVPFQDAAQRLRELYIDQGFDMDLLTNAMSTKTRKGREARKKKSKLSRVWSEEEIAASQDDYQLFCEALRREQSPDAPIGPPRNCVDLLDGVGDIGMEEFASMSTQDIWTDLGLPGATHLPFGNTDQGAKGAIIPMWHQVAGVAAVLKRAFTSTVGKPALPTMLCDDVGLGKTMQILVVIQMVVHLRKQQLLSPDKKLKPPPFAAKNNTPYLAGLDQVPNLPHLIVVPTTLSDQWACEVEKFTSKGSFHVVRFCTGQPNLSRFFAPGSGDYATAAGHEGKRADRVIVIADQSVGVLSSLRVSTIEKEALKCFKKPTKRGGRAALRQAARGDPNQLERLNEQSLAHSIWEQRFASVSYDESHSLRTVDRITNLACLKLSANSLLRVAATATPIFTGPKDISTQGRILWHQVLLDEAGVALYDKMRAAESNATKEWDDCSAEIIKDAIQDDTNEIAQKEGVEDQPARIAKIRENVVRKYESEDQLKILKSEYVNEESIEMLREAMLPIIVRRTGQSNDPDGKPLLQLRPYKEVTVWSILNEEEEAALDEVNEVHERHKKQRERGEAFDPLMLKWKDFLISQKDACIWAELVQLKRKAKEAGLKRDRSTLKITDGWTAKDANYMRSSRLTAVNTIVERYWTGNPKSEVYLPDGTRDQVAEEKQPNPPPLKLPRKYMFFIEYSVHRRLVKKMMELQGRKCVEYHGEMSTEQRKKAVETFKNDSDCRIMLIGKVAGAGLNLEVASILIFVNPVWSGLEKRQLIGRLWRLGQLNEVIVFDIIAPGGPDLVLAGYAGSKLALHNNFLEAERKLYEARCISDAVERDMEQADSESEVDIEAENKPVLAGVQRVDRTKVKPRKRKWALLGNAEPSDHNPTCSEAESSSQGMSKKSKAASGSQGNHPSWESPTVPPHRPSPPASLLGSQPSLPASILSKVPPGTKAAIFRGRRGKSRLTAGHSSGQGRNIASHRTLSSPTASPLLDVVSSPPSSLEQPANSSPPGSPSLFNQRSPWVGQHPSSSPPMHLCSSQPPSSLPSSSPPPLSPTALPLPFPQPPQALASDFRVRPAPLLAVSPAGEDQAADFFDLSQSSSKKKQPAPEFSNRKPLLRDNSSVATAPPPCNAALGSSATPGPSSFTGNRHNNYVPAEARPMGSERHARPSHPPHQPLDEAEALPALRSPLQMTDSLTDWQQKAVLIAAHRRGTTAPVRASATVWPLAKQKQPEGSCAPPVQLSASSQATNSEGAHSTAIKPNSQDHPIPLLSGSGTHQLGSQEARPQHKRKGFGLRPSQPASVQMSTSKKAASKAATKAALLDQRDAELSAPSAGPRAPPQIARYSKFDSRE
ncbi:ATP-dependent DNA helicase [Ceratobasidium sp. AG-Ba]|nr:ATP-dependent DNA helicase [Ceratobasidium sp. AG-Ba]